MSARFYRLVCTFVPRLLCRIERPGDELGTGGRTVPLNGTNKSLSHRNGRRLLAERVIGAFKKNKPHKH